MAINTLSSTFFSPDVRPEISAKFVKAKKTIEQAPSSNSKPDSVQISSQATQALQGNGASSVGSLIEGLADWGSTGTKPADKGKPSSVAVTKPSGKKPSLGGPSKGGKQKPTAQTKPSTKSSSSSKSSKTESKAK